MKLISFFLCCALQLRRLVIALCGGALLLAVIGSGAVRAAVFDPETFTLDNGMQVVVVPNHRAPIVMHMVWYKVGAADEDPGESGNAHFLEHLMFKGTETLAPGEFSEIIARNGGQENAFTSWDYTAYFQKVAKDRLETVMKLEADRMTNLVLTDEVVLPEREVVREERRSRIDNDPGSQLAEVAQASLFLNHPYRIPIIGWDHEIEALNTETALAFYRKWYAPNNAILIVAGDVTVEEVRTLAEKYYGVIPAKTVPERKRTTEPPQNAARRVEMKSPQVRSPSISIRYLAPSYRLAEGNEAYALQVLDEVIGSGASSRLYRKLAVEQGIAASVGSGYSPDDYDLSSFYVYIAPRPDVPLEKAEAALRSELALLREQGVSPVEVARAKRRMTEAAVFARDSLSTAPNVIGRALATGSSVEDVEAWPERIEAVTAEQVNAALRKILKPNSSVTSVLLPEENS